MNIIIGLMIAGLSPAQITIPVDSATSTHTVELCFQDKCDTDSSPLAGELTIDLDSKVNPAQISLHDFNLQSSNDLSFELHYGLFLGDIYATVSGLGTYHADPGGHQPFFPITNGQYTIANIPALYTGIADYQADGLICLTLELLGIPCSDTIDMSTWSESTFDALDGTIQIVDRVLHISASIAFTEPIDPVNPDLGTISQSAVINGSVLLAQPGDYNGDSDVDQGDYELFETCASGPAIPMSPGCEDRDFDSDNDVDQDDFAVFQRCISGPDILGNLDCAK